MKAETVEAPTPAERAARTETSNLRERARDHEATNIIERAVSLETPRYVERAGDHETPNGDERAVLRETPVFDERVRDVETPKLQERATSEEAPKGSEQRPRILSGEEYGGWDVFDAKGIHIDWFKEYADADSCVYELEGERGERRANS